MALPEITDEQLAGTRMLLFASEACPHIHGEITIVPNVGASVRIVNTAHKTLAIGMPAALTLINRKEIGTAVRLLQAMVEKLEGKITETEVSSGT